jgi:mRNA-degrading endonuclease toxin of MazEF toxin-antitoxin module
MVNQTRAVDKIRLIKKLGNLSEELMDRVNQALKLNYDLE